MNQNPEQLARDTIDRLLHAAGWVLNKNIVQNQFKRNLKRMTRARGNLTFVHNIITPIPPRSIQQAIVTKIEKLFSELNKSIETLHLAQQRLKTYWQAVL